MTSFRHRLVLACTFAGAALALFVGPAKRSSSRAPQDTVKTGALAALSQTNGKLRVAGLREPVEVLRDSRGVPHIYARDQHDLFFAQGFVEAQDRLFQMEMWKRAGQGRLAEVAGKSALPRDVAARLVRYRGSMQAEYESYAPDTREILEAFTAGTLPTFANAPHPAGPDCPSNSSSRDSLRKCGSRKIARRA
jgi:acyl-homoserine lactone acylase PvdQ